MLTGLLLALASVQAPAPTAGHGPAAPQAGGAHSCAIQGGEVVPTIQVAREIAEAIIRNRESAAEIAMMELSVQPVGDDAWDVVQTIPDRKEPDGSVTHTDGGGLAIRIDRCNGAIRHIIYVI